MANTSDSSSQETNSSELEIETQSSISVSPAIVNNIEQKKADELASNKVMNKVVYRAQLTSSIISREPIDNIDALHLQKQTALYFFTEIHGKNNKKIIHRWVFKQKNMAEITHNIGGDKWRTYSSKNFDDTMVGQWTVQVIDENNNVLKTIPFEVSR
jgi:hypothetical protein